MHKLVDRELARPDGSEADGSCSCTCSCKTSAIAGEAAPALNLSASNANSAQLVAELLPHGRGAPSQ